MKKIFGFAGVCAVGALLAGCGSEAGEVPNLADQTTYVVTGEKVIGANTCTFRIRAIGDTTSEIERTFYRRSLQKPVSFNFQACKTSRLGEQVTLLDSKE